MTRHPPRSRQDYSSRAVEAASRVLVDLGQVLASYQEAVVLIGGLVPGLLFPDVDPPHSRSIDVDVALDTERLVKGNYANLIQSLLDTGRYKLSSDKPFQLICTVDLEDGQIPIRVEVDFLTGKHRSLEKHNPKLVEGFRVLQADACDAAFRTSQKVRIPGHMVSGASNTVTWGLKGTVLTS